MPPALKERAARATLTHTAVAAQATPEAFAQGVLVAAASEAAAVVEVAVVAVDVSFGGNVLF